MKKNKLLIAGITGILALSLCACGSNSDTATETSAPESTTPSSISSTTKTYKKSADDKEDSIHLLQEFFRKTFEDENHVITASMDGKALYTENIKGTSDYIKYADSDRESWAFIDGDKKIYATSLSGYNSYMVGDEAYALGKDIFKSALTALENADAAEADAAGVTFSASESGETTDGESTAAITVTAKKESEGQVTLTAESKNGLVQTIVIDSDIKKDGQPFKQKMTMTISYGNAEVTLPDISKWEDLTGNMTITTN